MCRIFVLTAVYTCLRSLSLDKNSNQPTTKQASLDPSQANEILLLWNWKQISIYSCYLDLDIILYRKMGKDALLKKKNLTLKETITSVWKAKLYVYHPIILKAGFIITSESCFFSGKRLRNFTESLTRIKLLSGAIPLLAGIPPQLTLKVQNLQWETLDV